MQKNRPLRSDVPVKDTSHPHAEIKTPPRGAYQRRQGQGNSQLRVRLIQDDLIEEEQEEQNDSESIDPEAALCITELSKDWADVNHIAPATFAEVKNTTLNITK